MRWLLVILPLFLAAQCPNNFCEDATVLTLCDPMPFNSSDCLDYGSPVAGWPMLQSPYVTPQGWGGVSNAAGDAPYLLYNAHVYAFTIPTAGHYDMAYLGAIMNPVTGQNNGLKWALLYGDCSYLNVTMNWNTNSPFGWFAASTAFGAGWTTVGGLITFWQEEPIGWPYPPYVPNVGNTTSWNHTFYLLAGEYRLFLSSTQQDRHAVGTITICGSTPLNLPPELEVDGTTLIWSGATSFEFVVERANLSGGWKEFARTTENELKLNVGGYYRVLNEYGASKPKYVSRISNTQSGLFFDILGRQWLQGQSNYTIFAE